MGTIGIISHMTELSTRLKDKMKELKLTQEVLAARIGVTRSQIGHYLKARRVPPIDQVLKLEKALQMEPGELMYDSEVLSKRSKNVIFSPENTYTLPFLTNYDIKDYVKYGSLPENVRQDFVISNKKLSKYSYIVQITNNSMYAAGNRKSIQQGEYAVFDPKKDPVPNSSIVVAEVAPDDIRIRLYEQDGNKFFLRALDPSYPMIEITPKVTILGVVVSIHRDAEDL